MTTPSTDHRINEEGVDVAALAREVEAWLARDPRRTATQLAQHAGINPRGIWQVRNGQRPACSMDWADRLTLAMDVPLAAVAPPSDDGFDVERLRCGKKLDRHLKCISADDLKLAYELHWRGVPLNRIARTWQRTGRTTYKSEEAASTSMWSLFKTRGWPCRDRIDMVRRASTKHGRAGRAQARSYGPDYAAYRRQQRKRSGYVRDVRCAAANVNGEPCKRFALADAKHCVAHEPSRARAREQTMQAAWAASRARMLRWGDHRGQVERAIDEHGRPALCRASGICTTVLGKMLRYDDEQAFKPETWAKLRAGIDQVTRRSASPSGCR